MEVEQELAAALAATAERRAARATEIRRLAAEADLDRLAALLAGDRLLALLGARLVDLAPESVPRSFRDEVEEAAAHGRRRAVLTGQLALRLARALEDAGIRVAALKGPHLAERLHGDPGMRASNDVDLLVGPGDFHRAVAVLEGCGYRSEGRAPWQDGLPLFETSLTGADEWLPPVDLHWRLHWYERDFSRDFLARGRRGPDGLLIPEPVDELAALLLFWCRDGLTGLRHAADVGAWWDRHGDAVAGRALDGIAAAHPALRLALLAAALRAEQAVGVPAQRLLTVTGEHCRRLGLALRLARATDPDAPREAHAGMVAVDALLTPPGGRRAFLGRHVVLPGPVIAEIYALPDRARWRRALRRALYAAARGGRLATGAAGLLRAQPR